MTAPLLPPQPLPPTVKRFNSDGTPTPALVIYEQQMMQFLKALAAAVAGV